LAYTSADVEGNDTRFHMHASSTISYHINKDDRTESIINYIRVDFHLLLKDDIYEYYYYYYYYYYDDNLAATIANATHRRLIFSIVSTVCNQATTMTNNHEEIVLVYKRVDVTVVETYPLG
jgi:hypothetical protein